MFAAESTDGLCESAGEVEGGKSNAVQSASRMTCSAAAGVIAQDCVEDIEATVLNVPAATQVFQQKGRIGCGTRQAGDGVGRTATSLPLLDGVTFQADELLGTGTVEVLFVDRRGGRGDGAGFEAAAILLDGRGGLLLNQCFTHGVGAAEGGLSVTIELRDGDRLANQIPRRNKPTLPASWGHEGLLDVVQELRLIPFDRHEVVALLFDDRLADLALAVGRVSHDQFPSEYQPSNQIVRGLRFVGVR